MKKSSIVLIYLMTATMTTTASAKVYEDIPVARYKASYNLEHNKGQTFLKFMQTTLFAAISNEGPNQKNFEIAGVQAGEGVEVRLSKNVSTFHVGYKSFGTYQAERSGRSFSGVGYIPGWDSVPGKKPVVKYVADASYNHYLSALEDYLEDSSETEIRNFYKALFEIILNSDSSTVAALNIDGQQVLGDFVAVYVAEQYRRMTKGNGQGSLGYSPNWDDAHLQVTMLAPFHSGQDVKAMFYEGDFTSKIYRQINKVDGVSTCVYKQYNNPFRQSLKLVSPSMKDYTQFNAECARSGVNMTRKDFTTMGAGITQRLKLTDKALIKDLESALGNKVGRNFFDFTADYIIDNDAPEQFEAEQSEKVVNALVNLLMASRKEAKEITSALAKESADGLN